MTKAELSILEKMFALEVEAALGANITGIYQSRSKLLPKMETDGLVKRAEYTIPADRSCPFPIKVRGWELTIAGHAAYCLTCSDDGST